MHNNHICKTATRRYQGLDLFKPIFCFFPNCLKSINCFVSDQNQLTNTHSSCIFLLRLFQITDAHYIPPLCRITTSRLQMRFLHYELYKYEKPCLWKMKKRLIWCFEIKYFLLLTLFKRIYLNSTPAGKFCLWN
jgi:hypothetical protein